MGHHFDGVFSADKSYSHVAMARIFGRKPRWVIQNILATSSPDDEGDPGVPALKIGALYMIAGSDFIRWVERNAKPIGKTKEEV